MLNDRLYNQILSQFKITFIFNHITAKHIADLTSMKVISFCTATLVCVHNSTPYDQCTLYGR